MDVRFKLELVQAHERDLSQVPLHLRELIVEAESSIPMPPKTRLIAPIGRHHQPDRFLHWLPDDMWRTCVSRKALEIQWDEGSDQAWLLAKGTNPLSVDGLVAQHDVRMELKPSSEIRFTYLNKVSGAVRLASVALPPQNSLSLQGPALAPYKVVEPFQDSLPSARSRGQVVRDTSVVDSSAFQDFRQTIAAPKELPMTSEEFERTSAQTFPKTSEWKLVCLHAEGLGANGVMGLPSDMRDIELQDGISTVGRSFQPRHFGVWLQDPTLRLAGVAAEHLQLIVSASSIDIRMLCSKGGLYVDQELLPAGELCELKQGQTLSFTRSGAPSCESFLILQLQMTFSPTRVSTVVPPTVSMGSTSAGSGVNSGTCSSGASCSIDAVATPAAVAPREDSRVLAASSSARQLPAAEVSPKRTGAPCVLLELFGDGVRDLPLEQRSIGPHVLGDQPLLVGKRHQAELHSLAVREEMQGFISADHFCVAAYTSSGLDSAKFWLLVMTPDRPVWLRPQRKEEAKELNKDDLVAIYPGDEICIGPGVWWLFREVESAVTERSTMYSHPSLLA